MEITKITVNELPPPEPSRKFQKIADIEITIDQLVVESRGTNFYHKIRFDKDQIDKIHTAIRENYPIPSFNVVKEQMEFINKISNKPEDTPFMLMPKKMETLKNVVISIDVLERKENYKFKSRISYVDGKRMPKIDARWVLHPDF